MKLIGLTGGIGSGKSTVAEVFYSLGIPVFKADIVGREMLEKDEKVISAVKDLLGNHVYIDGKPDRKQIAQQVFSDPTLLAKLNAIIHPAVDLATKNWLNCLDSKTSYALKEAAILFESGANAGCDAVIVVTAPESLRIERVIQRDGSSPEEVESRMAQQWSEEKKVILADYTIANNGEESVILQVLQLHQSLSGEGK